MPLNRQQRRAKASQQRRHVKHVRKAIASASPVNGRARLPALAGALSLQRPVQIAAAAAPAPDGKPAGPRTFTLVAYTGEPMNIYPFDAPVVVDLDSYVPGNPNIPALYDHCPSIDYIVGQVESVGVEASPDGPALVARGRFTLTDQPIDRNYALQVLQQADAGYQWQVSIGANAGTLTKIEQGIEFTANGGRKYVGPAYLAKRPEFRELSFVVIGGDGKTSAVVARRGRQPSTPTPTPIKGSAMSFEEWLMSLGFADPAALDDVQRANLKLMYNEQYPAEEAATETAAEGIDPPVEPEEPPPANAHGRRPAIRGTAARTPPVDPIVARRRAEAAEAQRCDDVRRILAGAESLQIETADPAHPGQRRKIGLLAHALAEGWDANRTELERLRAERGAGPAVLSRSHDADCTVEALQGAMILRAGGRLDHPAYQSIQAVALRLPTWLRAGINADQRQRAMEFAHRFSSLSAVDLCRESCRLAGVQASYDRAEMIRAAFSGGALTNIFTTNVNALLLASYMEAEDTTMGWVSEQDVNDFKTNERPRVNVGPGLKKLPRGSEAEHSNYSDGVESYKISRYARQFQVDEQDMIDDNLGVFADQPKRHGDAARRLRPDLVYGILLSNPTLTATGRALFNSTDANLLTSAALAAAKLRAAIAAQRNFRENSVNLNLKTTHVLVPPSLEELAWELANATEILIAGTAGSVTERGNVNTLKRHGLMVVSDSRLENGVVYPDDESSQSGSATTWYTAAAGAQTIEVGYLKGSGRAPQVRSSPLDKGKWGINWDVCMDIGAKALDWKGMTKNTA